MKIIYIECDAEELKANRGIMDSVIDLFGNISRSIFGNSTLSAEDNEEGEEDSELSGGQQN